VPNGAWELLSLGLKQRVRALNSFIRDVTMAANPPRRTGPAELILHNDGFQPRDAGFLRRLRSSPHVAGIDVVRLGRAIFVLEDSAAHPAAFPTCIEGREAMRLLVPRSSPFPLSAPIASRRVAYPRTAGRHNPSPPPIHGDPRVALLTPGSYNSAYYEHSFLADEIASNSSRVRFIVDENVVYIRTTEGPKRIDVIYRRIDDTSSPSHVSGLDSAVARRPLQRLPFRSTYPRHMRVGAGLRDDKSFDRYVPK